MLDGRPAILLLKLDADAQPLRRQLRAACARSAAHAASPKDRYFTPKPADARLKPNRKDSVMRKPSASMVVAGTALFVALGGVGVAATGGNFILGNPNTAEDTTELSSGVTAGPT